MPQRPVPSARVAPLVAALPAGEPSTAVAAAVDDTLTAVDWLTERAEALGLDLDRLGLVGSSAGAVTADHVAYVLDDHGVDGPDVAVVGSLWGGILLPPPGGGAPADQLGPGEAPLFAVHGDADQRVPVARSDELAARAEAQGVTVEYHRIPEGSHGYDGARFFTEQVDGGGTPLDHLLDFVEAALA